MKSVVTCLVAALFLFGASLVVAAYKSRTPQVETFNQGLSILDDFLEPNSNTTPGSYTGMYFGSINSGGTVVRDSFPNYPGSVEMRVESVADRACLTFADSLALSNGTQLTTETRFNVDTLMASGENSEIYFGFITTTGSNLASLANALVLTYDKGISDNFRIYHKTGGVVTQTTLDYPLEAGEDYYLRIIIAGSKGTFLINNVVVGTMELRFASSVTLSPAWFLEKNLGSTDDQHVAIDAVAVYQQFVVPRLFVNTNITQ